MLTHTQRNADPRMAGGTSAHAEGLEDARVDASKVFLIGLRSWQHASHSGYEGFGRYIGTHLKSPVEQRIRAGHWSSRLDRWLERSVRRQDYTFPLLLTEAAVALHMLGRRRAVYHVLYGDSDYWMLGRLARWTGNAVVATFHEGDETLAYYRFDRRFFRHLSAAILLCEAQRPFFEPFLPTDRIFVVPHGVHTGFFAPTERRDTGRICITVGGHTRDFATLAKAIRLVWEQDPTVRFVAIGTRIGNKKEFVCEGVEFRERLTDDELLHAYRGASLAVYSLEWAAANNAILESMACGLPIVATDVGGVREYVGDDAGILCPPADPGALAAAILGILDDPLLAARLGAAARRRALACDYRVVADRLREVYAAILQTASRARSHVVPR